MRDKVIVGGASVAVVAVLAAAVLAFAVPEDHTASRSALYGRSSDELFDVITAYGDTPRWRSDLSSVTSRSGEQYIEHGEGGDVEIQVVESKRPRRVVTERAGPGDFGGSWTFEISVEGSGARLTITERGSIHDPIDRVLTHYLSGHTAALDTYLIDLGKLFGEDVDPR